MFYYTLSIKGNCYLVLIETSLYFEITVMFAMKNTDNTALKS